LITLNTAGKASAGGDAEEKKKEKEREVQLARVDNVKQQISALLTFKDALCSGECTCVRRVNCVRLVVFFLR